MGAFQESSPNIFQFGFRIYKLIKDGPLDKAGAKEMTDFIIPPDEVLYQKNTFKDWILSIADQTIKMKLYSLSIRNFKIIEIKTNKADSKDGVLGAGVKFENFENAEKKLLHVISVQENSFAQKNLGLIPNEDYIIAVKGKDTRIISLNIEEYNPLEVLNMVISNNKGKNLIFYIYNKKKGALSIETKIEEGDDFVLGCDVAYGALHEFPKEESEIAEEIIKGNENIDIIKQEKTDNIEKKGELNPNEDKNVIEEDII
jgi:hypothetical protein